MSPRLITTLLNTYCLSFSPTPNVHYNTAIITCVYIHVVVTMDCFYTRLYPWIHHTDFSHWIVCAVGVNAPSCLYLWYLPGRHRARYKPSSRTTTATSLHRRTSLYATDRCVPTSCRRRADVDSVTRWCMQRSFCDCKRPTPNHNSLPTVPFY